MNLLAVVAFIGATAPHGPLKLVHRRRRGSPRGVGEVCISASSTGSGRRGSATAGRSRRLQGGGQRVPVERRPVLTRYTGGAKCGQADTSLPGHVQRQPHRGGDVLNRGKVGHACGEDATGPGSAVCREPPGRGAQPLRLGDHLQPVRVGADANPWWAAAATGRIRYRGAVVRSPPNSGSC